ncbi:MAG: prolyl oligopeptidase family serine peptidase [Chloroflexi bacterium]|nr:prolyl oligopeptidase family serine peptidase [Chloroflexota bacterium]
MTVTPRRRRLRRLGVFFVLMLAFGLFGIPALCGCGTMYWLVHPGCGGDATTPSDFGYNDWEDLAIDARAGGSFQAYFIPGDNGATIIIPPTGGAGRGSRLDLADMLARNGYAVLTYDSRRCADLGNSSLGYKEISEVEDVVDYLLAREDVDPDRIGITGFSAAGATTIMAAARRPELRAIIAEGGYGDFAEGAVGLYDGGGSFVETTYKWSLSLSYRLFTGEDIDRLSPLDVIDRIAPRPILLIYGTKEASLSGAYEQQAAAGDNATLWVVAGAGHGEYQAVAPAEYEQRVIEFFDQALLGED